jgi:hypothetical protein
MAWHGMAVGGLETDIYVATLDIDRSIGASTHALSLCLSSLLARVACSRAAVRQCDGATQERALTKCGGIPASLPSGLSSNRAAASFHMQPSATRGGAR